MFICSVEIRLQEILGEAGMPLVRCVLVRWELLVQENLRVIQKFEGVPRAHDWSAVKTAVFEVQMFHSFRTFLWAP